MAQHIVPITNGKGSKEIVDGLYNVTADIEGYDNTSIDPKQLNIVAGTDTYNLTIAANGTLTLHVTDDGTDAGIPIEGASFYRSDSQGNHYGAMIETDASGDAVFEHVPHGGATPPIIYFVQTGSDGSHTFDTGVQQTSMNGTTTTIQIENAEADLRTFTITDANYANLSVSDGQITLAE